MKAEKNLHTSLTTALLTQLQQTAAAERTTLDELVQDAVESLLNRKEWQDVLLFGERHAQVRNLTESDIQEAIAAVGSESSSNGR